MTIKELCELKKSGYTAEEIVHLNENGLVTISEEIKSVETVKPVEETKPDPIPQSNPLEEENEKLKEELARIQEDKRNEPAPEVDTSDLSEIIDIFR